MDIRQEPLGVGRLVIVNSEVLGPIYDLHNLFMKVLAEQECA